MSQGNGSIPNFDLGVVWGSGWAWPHLNQIMAGDGQVFCQCVFGYSGGGGNEELDVLAIAMLAQLIEVDEEG